MKAYIEVADPGSVGLVLLLAVEEGEEPPDYNPPGARGLERGPWVSLGPGSNSFTWKLEKRAQAQAPLDPESESELGQYSHVIYPETARALGARGSLLLWRKARLDLNCASALTGCVTLAKS